MSSSRKRVGILVDTSSGWGRRVIRGVANYALKRSSWQLVVEERGINETMQLQAEQDVDGIIARIGDRQLHDELVASGKPVVNVSGILLDGIDLPRVTTDYEALGRLALQHFIDRGFRNLAYTGLEYRPYEQRHCRAFTEAADSYGLPCSVFDSTCKSRIRSRDTDRTELARWLQQLPKPLGILTWGNRRARTVLNACHQAGMAVPEQVAVLSGDDDELLCEVCHPPLSAVVTPAEQMGHEAARILDAIMQGEPAPQEPMLIPPTNIHTRLSTDTLAIADPHMCRAIAFIRDNLRRPIQVSDVAAAAGLSRRALERRFEKQLTRSPAREIQRTRLEQAGKLLQETDLPVAHVAATCGYGSMEYLIKVFRESTGHTPLKYRSRIKAR
jgi:LacI family transcriptional regulator